MQYLSKKYRVITTEAVLTIEFGMNSIRMGNFYGICGGLDGNFMGLFRTLEDAEYICNMLNNADDQLKSLINQLGRSDVN